MLDQATADRLLAVGKKLLDGETIVFPLMGSFLLLDAAACDGPEQFKLDVQRKCMRRSKKCTYQKRYQQNEILLRVDLDGPPHDNPDGEEVPCPHLHVYREGFGDRWAVALPAGDFPTPTDIVQTLGHFLKYCRIDDFPEIQRRLE